MSGILIAPKHISEFTPEEYHTWVSSMYSVRTKRTSKPSSPASGISVSRTKLGLSLRRTKLRTFAYVTWKEIELLSAFYRVSQSELWQLFKAKKWIIAKDRMEAETAYATTKGVTL